MAMPLKLAREYYLAAGKLLEICDRRLDEYFQKVIETPEQLADSVL